MSLGVAAGNENDLKIKERVPKTEDADFLDACYTPSSKTTKKARMLILSIQKRVTAVTRINIAAEILSVIKN